MRGAPVAAVLVVCLVLLVGVFAMGVEAGRGAAGAEKRGARHSRSKLQVVED